MHQLHPVLVLQGYPWKRAFFHDLGESWRRRSKGKEIQLHLECLAVDFFKIPS